MEAFLTVLSGKTRCGLSREGRRGRKRRKREKDFFACRGRGGKNAEGILSTTKRCRLSTPIYEKKENPKGPKKLPEKEKGGGKRREKRPYPQSGGNENDPKKTSERDRSYLFCGIGTRRAVKAGRCAYRKEGEGEGGEKRKIPMFAEWRPGTEDMGETRSVSSHYLFGRGRMNPLI